MVTRATFPLKHLGTKLRRVCDGLYNGLGLMILRGLEVDNYDEEDCATVFLGLVRHIAEDCGAQDHIIRDIIALLAVQCSEREGLSTIAPLRKPSLRIPLKQGDIGLINNLDLPHGGECCYGAEGSPESTRHILRLRLRNRKVQWTLPPALKLAWAGNLSDSQRRRR